MSRVIVFTRTKRGANQVANALDTGGVRVVALHGNKSQPARQKALEQFRAGRARVLVATDIAARGIDVTGVSHVINFDLPAQPEDYVHRVGRTARAGASGIAISFCDSTQQDALHTIERLTGTRLQIVGGSPSAVQPQRTQALTDNRPAASARTFSAWTSTRGLTDRVARDCTCARAFGNTATTSPTPPARVSC